MTERTNRPTEDNDDVGNRRFRRVAAVHLGVAAAINILTGWALLYIGSTNQMVRWAFTFLDLYVSPQFLVREADLVAALGTTGLLLAGGTFVLVGALTIPVVREASYGRHSTSWWVASVGSAVNPLAIPVALVALVLLWLDHHLRTGGPLHAVLTARS